MPRKNGKELAKIHQSANAAQQSYIQRIYRSTKTDILTYIITKVNIDNCQPSINFILSKAIMYVKTKF